MNPEAFGIVLLLVGVFGLGVIAGGYPRLRREQRIYHAGFQDGYEQRARDGEIS